jgi:hypothetical protein
MSQAGGGSLGQDEVASLRSAIRDGQRPTVYFTAAAVGVDAARSGKVTAMGEVAEGEFIHVKPAGQSDVLAFSPAELALHKPRQNARQPTGGSRPSGNRAAATPAPDPQQKGAAAAPAKVTITIASDEQGAWRVDVLTGRRKPVRSLAVSAGSVGKAASALAPEVAEAIDTALAAAREKQRARVERLRAELATAQRTLDELG